MQPDISPAQPPIFEEATKEKQLKYCHNETAAEVFIRKECSNYSQPQLFL